MSLGIIYSLILLFNPWEATRANPRMVIPLLSHLFIWVLLFYNNTYNYPKALKLVTRAVLIVSLLLVVDNNKGNWVFKDYSNTKKSYLEIQNLKHFANGKPLPVIYVAEKGYWEYVSKFAGPMLYLKHRFIPFKTLNRLKNFDILISPPASRKIKGLLKYKELRIDNKLYIIYKQRG